MHGTCCWLRLAYLQLVLLLLLLLLLCVCLRTCVSDSLASEYCAEIGVWHTTCAQQGAAHPESQPTKANMAVLRL